MDKRKELIANEADVERANQELDVRKDKGRTWNKPQLKVLDAKKNTLFGTNISGDGPGYS